MNAEPGCCRDAVHDAGVGAVRLLPVYFGLGSNIGDRLGNLRQSAAIISSASGMSSPAVSRVYETEPWGPVQQPSFLNCVVMAHTSLAPAELLALAASVETALGRVRLERWGPRSIDVDILLLGDERVNTADLVIPHPRMWERAFVLIPLADLSPNMIVPLNVLASMGLADSVRLREFVRRLPDASGVRPVDERLQGVFRGTENTAY
ncbi:MAG: 2-amino-4-hydroxy-6-hydroxymethyldihydropteridine diphosphokinase [Clostridia bacterium]|nr:2-amino-4-hydroxy-6-hydroxymethyldihydropteridine diphosphokinase [Clostridia bacterium]